MKVEKGIILVYGLPGSGKTTASRQLVTDIKAVLGLEATHLDADTIEGIKLAERGQKGSTLYGQFDSAVWRESRDSVMELVSGGQWKGLMIIDDTFLLKGQRRKYRSLARREGIAYCEVLCELSFQSMMERNGSREESKRLRPELLQELWQKMEREENQLGLIKGEAEDLSLQLVVHVLQRSVEHFKQLDLEEADHISESSELAEYELALRKEVSRMIKEAKEKGLDIEKTKQEAMNMKKEKMIWKKTQMRKKYN